MPYSSNPDFANCVHCGVFTCLTSGSHGIRAGEKTYFRAENEMDVILKNLYSRMVPTKNLFNPSSSYSSIRRPVIDWMCELCEVLKFQEETTHHALSLFDQFFASQENAIKIKADFEGKSFGQVV
jgi:hypothetical protein